MLIRAFVLLWAAAYFPDDALPIPGGPTFHALHSRLWFFHCFQKTKAADPRESAAFLFLLSYRFPLVQGYLKLVQLNIPLKLDIGR